MTGFWGETPLLFEDLPLLPVVLCALGFGCGGTPKSAGQLVEWNDPATALTAPGATESNREIR